MLLSCIAVLWLSGPSAMASSPPGSATATPERVVPEQKSVPATPARPAAHGGAACVMAKWMGQTMDYVLVVGRDHPQAAIEEGERVLIDKGYGDYRARGSKVDVIHAQAITALPHAYVIVIKSDWSNWRGNQRTNYGCGFSADSYADALWEAIGDLQNHAWGWKPDRDGYELIEKLRY